MIDQDSEMLSEKTGRSLEAHFLTPSPLQTTSFSSLEVIPLIKQILECFKEEIFIDNLYVQLLVDVKVLTANTVISKMLVMLKPTLCSLHLYPTEESMKAKY